jgi:hypothetical protein
MATLLPNPPSATAKAWAARLLRGSAKTRMLLTKISASSIPLAKFFALFTTFLFFGAGRAS